MANTASLNIVILWEHELIAAAESLKNCQGDDTTPEDFRAMFQACWAALAPEALTKDANITIISGRL